MCPRNPRTGYTDFLNCKYNSPYKRLQADHERKGMRKKINYLKNSEQMAT
jgi:hypothetical protein